MNQQPMLLPADVYGDIPTQFRTPDPPSDPKEEVLYRLAWIQHIENSPVYTWPEKSRLLRIQRKLLEAAKNAHECSCCGIMLRIPAPIGPECAKHPLQFPCNRRRKVA